MNLLYLSYDGITDPLGGSQVLPYLAGLSERGYRIWLISCEKDEAEPQAWERVRALCRERSISWHPIRYHKRPPILSTLWDVRAVFRTAARLQREVGFEWVHCRSYVAALVGSALKQRFRIKFLFDMRGFWPEERVEGGYWRLANPLYRAVYRYFKAREADFFREADSVVSNTEAGSSELRRRPEGFRPVAPITVIPCCVDFDHFKISTPDQRLASRRELGLQPDVAVLLYLGSLGGVYMLEEMLQFFAAFREREPDARFLFITREKPDAIRHAALRMGIGDEALVIRSADRAQVPRFIGVADIGISFIRPTFSKTAASPVKLGELLAVGVPTVVNSGVGDVDQVMHDVDAGVVIDRFDKSSLMKAVDEICAFPPAPERIRAGAERWFRLQAGIEKYDSIYRSSVALSQT